MSYTSPLPNTIISLPLPFLDTPEFLEENAELFLDPLYTDQESSDEDQDNSEGNEEVEVRQANCELVVHRF
jgi:hypothetical protein